MKKKFLLAIVIAAILTCLLAIGVNAQRVEDYEDTFTLRNTSSIVHYEKWFYNDGKSFVRQKYSDSITVSFFDENGTPVTEVPMWEYDEKENKYYSLVWYISDYKLTWEDQIYSDANVGDQTYPKYTAALYTLSKVRAVDLRYVINTYNTSHSAWSEAKQLKSLKAIYHTNGTPDDTDDDIRLQHAQGIGRDNDNYGYFGYDAQFAATGNKIVVGNFRDCDFERDEEGNYGTSNTWSSAYNLQCVWYPDTVKYIVSGSMGGCSEIDLGDGIEIIACQILRDNKNIKEFVVPNSCIYLNNEAFRGTDLTKLTIGEGLLAHGNDPFLYTGGSDFIYFSKNITKGLTSALPKLVANQSATIYFDGNLEEATAFMNRLISEDSGYNNKITLVDYKTTQERGDVKNVCLFYNYNRCDAFYRGAHENSVTYGFDGEDKYTSNFCMFEGCTKCDNKQTTVYGKLFVNKGYSKANGSSSFSYGIVFNKDVIEEYTSAMGVEFDYGFVAATIKEGADGTLVNSDGSVVDPSYIQADFTTTSYSIYNMKLTGITEEYRAKQIYCSAYIIDDGTVLYIGDSVTEKAVGICYNDIVVTTVPATDEE